MRSAHPVKPLPYEVYLAAALALAAGGLLLSVYLAYSHYRVYTDIAYSSFCALSKAINCDTVSQSPYSIFLNLPVPLWGAAGYAGLALLLLSAALPAAGRKRGWTLAMLGTLGFSGVSLFLAGVSTFGIGSYCIVCIATYGVNLLLVFLAWLVRRRFDAGPFAEALREDVQFLAPKSRIRAAAGLAFLSFLVLTWQTLPAYWEVPPAELPSGRLKSGVTTEGLPWIGAERPELEILEFADYQCFQCRKMHYYLRQLVASRPEKIRLVHCHYPMDHEVNFIVAEPFHVGSAKLAQLAIYAKFQGKFWEMNDLLYRLAGSGRKIELQAVSAELGLDVQGLAAVLEHPGYRKALELEIRHGMKLQVLGTPSYLIEGRIYEGTIPAEILARVSG
jgi:uncharacterized membrane protein/predicted DsbA family dithiol-disulfide isomerase